MTFEKDRLRFVACVGKAKHETFAAATKQLARGKRVNKSVNKRTKLGVYECQFCDGFHIGHQPKRAK